MDLKSKIILISGPTASGKSKFAIELAKKINGEVINADSMQIFKELKILTARPHRNDLKKISPQHNFQNIVNSNIETSFFVFIGLFIFILFLLNNVSKRLRQ